MPQPSPKLIRAKSTMRWERRGHAPSIASIVRISAPAAQDDETYTLLTGTLAELHPSAAVKGLFVNDIFADEVDAFVAEQRRRERDEAEREAEA